MRVIVKALCVAFCSVIICVHPAKSDVRLPKLIGDGMVLQRDKPLKIWGWAAPGEKVTVDFIKKKYNTVAGADGTWQIMLKPIAAGGPYNMTVTGNNKIEIADILLGDVWFCSGQSNMEMGMGDIAEKYEKIIAQNQNTSIRQFLVPKGLNDATKIHDDFSNGRWAPATGTNVNRFSAAAYFFAINLFEREHVPIGLINSSFGGTPIESWISADGYKTFPEIAKQVVRLSDTAYVNQMNRNNAANNRLQAARTDKKYDDGLNETPKWYETAYQPVGWKDIMVPGFWTGQGLNNFSGVVWYRKVINVPAADASNAAKLYFGRINDNDEVYINGQLAGRTGGQYANRMYTLKSGLLVPGKNVIVARLSNNASALGGFVGDKPYYITAGTDTIQLSGKWQYKVGQAYPAVKSSYESYSAANQPTLLYNTMVAPAGNYVIKGALWYQGESNVTRAKEYERLLPELIANWRALWHDPKLPFIIAQLPNYQEVTYLPVESGWAELREAERKALAIPNTAMAVLIDVGEWGDIHPRDKKDVGERLALAAEKLVYGHTTLVASGPTLQGAKKDGNKVVLTFTDTGSGLIAKNSNKLQHFAIAGADKHFVWATAQINGNQVIVWSDEVPDPAYVRYAWANNPDRANLYNKEGLPASPFEAEVK
ncbi:MAG: sialate O-acetylesterase [Mucilaginibacter sp.]